MIVLVLCFDGCQTSLVLKSIKDISHNSFYSYIRTFLKTDTNVRNNIDSHYQCSHKSSIYGGWIMNRNSTWFIIFKKKRTFSQNDFNNCPSSRISLFLKFYCWWITRCFILETFKQFMQEFLSNDNFSDFLKF